jgi:quinoprotein relay system zinc metallohydrolase 1
VLEGAVADFDPKNGCNIINTGWIVTPAGVTVINTGPSWRYGQQQRQALERWQRQGAGPGAIQVMPQVVPQVVQVLNLNLHPDYFFGNQAWADTPTRALAGSMAGMQAEGAAYASNLYALCGDWMLGTEATPAREVLSAGAPPQAPQAESGLELLRLQGHTADDLVVLDHRSGVVFTGGLVFAERIPTTPHANLAAWLNSLDQLEQRLRHFKLVALVPSHGPVYPDARGVQQTRDYLLWLRQRLADSAAQGLDISEVLALPLPQPYARWGAAQTEYARNIAHLYPAYERAALGDSRPSR